MPDFLFETPPTELPDIFDTLLKASYRLSGPSDDQQMPGSEEYRLLAMIAEQVDTWRCGGNWEQSIHGGPWKPIAAAFLRNLAETLGLAADMLDEVTPPTR